MSASPCPDTETHAHPGLPHPGSPHPAVAAAREVADDLLAGAAGSDDPARGVRRETLRDLAGRGLVSVLVPTGWGGSGADARVAAEVEEILAGADAATWFVLTQHRYPQRLTTEPAPGETPGPAADRHAAALARGDALAGIALAHLRRPGPPAVRATPDGEGGWRLDGRSDWCTGWGLVDLVLVAAVTDDERIVFSLIPAVERPGLTATDPLPLAVMGGTRTVALELDGVAVAADEVAATVDASVWHGRDAGTVVDTKPASLGLLRRVIAETRRTGHDRDRPAAEEAADALEAVATPLRDRAYAMAGDPDRVDERIALRGQVAELTVRAANALVAARGGSAMLLASPEQRWCREASFHLVQAQTDAVRTAQLAAFRRS